MSASTTGWTAIGERAVRPGIAAAVELIGRYVVIRDRGPAGCTTIRSYVTDVSVEGADVEVQAVPGHLFPLATVTVADCEDDR